MFIVQKRLLPVMPDLIRHPASPHLRAERTDGRRVFRAMDMARLDSGSRPE
jgi:hypothetical protein